MKHFAKFRWKHLLLSLFFNKAVSLRSILPPLPQLLSLCVRIQSFSDPYFPTFGLNTEKIDIPYAGKYEPEKLFTQCIMYLSNYLSSTKWQNHYRPWLWIGLPRAYHLPTYPYVYLSIYLFSYYKTKLKTTLQKVLTWKKRSKLNFY